MTEQEKKTTPAQRKQAERNRDAAQRQRDLFGALIEAKKKQLEIRLANYAAGPDFKFDHAFQKSDEFWEASKEIDRVKGLLEIADLEAQVIQIDDRIKVYTEMLAERG